MGEIRGPAPVQLVAGILANPGEGLDGARRRVEAAWGPVETASPVWEHTFTDYYRDEMGEGLLRQLVAFEGLREVEGLWRVKVESNEMEREVSEVSRARVRRPVNIDPGYIMMSRLVLFTTKDFSHRIYVGGGVYAENTLVWRGGGFQTQEWTYPDYGSKEYGEFFAGVRERYAGKLKEAGRGVR